MHPDFDGTYPPIGRSEVIAETGRREPKEPCLLAQALRPWDLVCTPLSTRYGYQMVFLRTASPVVYYERYEAGMRLRGTAAPNMLAFAAPLRVVPDTRYWKAPPQSAPGFLCLLLRRVRPRSGGGCWACCASCVLDHRFFAIPKPCDCSKQI